MGVGVVALNLPQNMDDRKKTNLLVLMPMIAGKKKSQSGQRMGIRGKKSAVSGFTSGVRCSGKRGTSKTLRGLEGKLLRKKTAKTGVRNRGGAGLGGGSTTDIPPEIARTVQTVAKGGKETKEKGGGMSWGI